MREAMKAVIAFTIVGSLLVSSHPAQAASSSHSPASREALTLNLVDTFVFAYNQHDLSGVMSLVGSHIVYSDCNYATHQAKKLVGRTAVRRWFKRMFALNDGLYLTDMTTGGWVDNAYSPNVFGLMGNRQNDAISQQHLPDQPFAAKGMVNGNETRLRALVLAGQANCDL